MDAITHLLVGRLLGAAAGQEAAALGWLATLFAVLPDFDTISWAFPRLQRWIRHRGITHTLPFGIGASLVAGVVFAVAGWSSFALAFVVAFVAFLSHVALDVLNWGAPVLWPWRAARVEWTIHGGFVWSAALSAAALVALGAAQSWLPELAPRLASAFGGAFVAYLMLRAVAKARVARRNKGRRVLPTGNPFVWRVLDSPTVAPTAVAPTH